MFSALMLFTAQPALACSCMPMTRAETVKEADAVITGTVTEVVNQEMLVLAKIDVDDVEKGEVDEQVTVQSNGQSAACGIGFKQGQKVTLALNEQDGTYRANLCMQMGLGK